MKFRRLALAGIATFALATIALAEDRAPTEAEKASVQDALNKAGYSMVMDVQVDDDKFTADAKTKDGKDVGVTLDMKTLKVLSEKPN
jgi:hypothetical protein